MKLVRFGEKGREKPGVLREDGAIVDCSSIAEDWDNAFLNGGGLSSLEVKLEGLPAAEGEPRLGACIARPYKIICIGLNYSDHAKESGMDIPEQPILFMKATSAWSGPYDPLVHPKTGTKMDWEVELGIVIGKDCRNLESKEEALGAVAGYCVVHDASERAYQIERGGQWVKGKSYDSFCPVGPWLVTKDEIEDVGNLAMKLSVNGKTMQDGNTSTMIFDVPTIVEYVSEFMTLEAGDLICTGTPPGVAMGIEGTPWLKPGDVCELSIEGLGSQRQEVVSDER